MNIYLGKWTFIAFISILFHHAIHGQSSQSADLPISEIENFSSSEASNLTNALAPIGIERDGITYYEDSGAFNFLARLKHGEVLDLIDRFCDKDSIDPECITSGTCPCGDKIIAGLAFIPKWTTFDADGVERSESEKSFYTEGLGVALVLFGQKNGFPNAIFIAGVEDQSLEDVVKSGIDKTSY